MQNHKYRKYEHWSCGKIAYKRKKQALTAANTAASYKGTGLNVYRCPECAHWHMTRKIQD